MATIGIDFGTSNSCMSYLNNNKIEVIPNIEGYNTTPSVISLYDNYRLVGKNAKHQSLVNPLNTMSSIKKYIGKKYIELDDINDNRIKENEKGDIKIELNNHELYPQEIAAMILQKLKIDAEYYLNQEVDSAVITVPAYFNEIQRQSIRDAALIAGLKIKRIINEPTAAALAYGLDKTQDSNILVFDLGAGTFDVSILELSQGVFKVLATNGDNNLGGNNFDLEIVNWIIEEYKKEKNIDLSKDYFAMQRINKAAEKAKIQLSEVYQTVIDLPFIDNKNHLILDIDRNILNEISKSLLEKIKEPLIKVIEDSKLKTVDYIILVGGMTKMPVISEVIKEITNQEPLKGINPDYAVSFGAAIQAGILEGDIKDILLLDVTPLSLGIELEGGIMEKIINRNSIIPIKKSQIFTTYKDNQTTVDIHILQGERELVKYNKSLANICLDNILSKKGEPTIEVYFEIDVNGLLTVKAIDLLTNKEKSLSINSENSIDSNEINKLIYEAKLYYDKDKVLKEKLYLQNQARQLIELSKLQLNNLNLNKTQIKLIDYKIHQLELNLDNDKEVIKKLTNDLQDTFYEITQSIYINFNY